MKIKAIIFDMDGTIIDTTGIWNQVNKEVVKSCGRELTEEQNCQINNRVHGMSLPKACQLLKDVAGLEQSIDEMIAIKSQVACDLYRQGIKFIEGFEAFHHAVVQKDLLNAIATNADKETLAITKDVLKIDRFFGEHIYDISCVGNVCKPNPDIYLHASSMLGVNPDECIAIEDSAHGVAAAKSAGMFCIGINTSKNLDQLKACDHIIEGYDELELDAFLHKHFQA